MIESELVADPEFEDIIDKAVNFSKFSIPRTQFR